MDERRGSMREARENWRRSELPFATKARLWLRNNFKKVRTRKGCCGNDGEPGC
ncbi:MAG: hypothetical protein ACKVVT_08850 [Dehalococcoidia bacterium]